MRKLYYFKFLVTLFVFYLIINTNSKALDSLKAGGSSWIVTSLNNPAPGYIRLDWTMPNYFYLIDNYGKMQFGDSTNKNRSFLFKPLTNGQWISYVGNNYLLYDENMKLVDSIPFPKSYIVDPHEVTVLSNGHYLLLCQENVFVDLSKIVKGGQENAQIISNVLIETDRTGTIYWLWKAYDYLKITDVTPDIDLTQLSIDYTHINSFEDTQDGNILISFRHLDEITKINKKTGQIIWRLGGSMCKNNQFTFLNDSNNDNNGFVGFSHQHSVSLLANGDLLMLDNGNLKNPPYSRAVEYKIDETLKTVKKVWEYRNSPDIYQYIMGSAFRLSNGNTLINWGNSKMTEVKPDNSVAFDLRINTGQVSAPSVYRAYRIINRMNAVSLNISGKGDYSFNDSIYKTGATISVSSINGSGLTCIEKHNYAPPTGEYIDSSFSFIYPYRWVFSQNGISNISGIIKINASAIPQLGNPNQVSIYKRDQEASGIFEELITVYDSISGEITANFTGFGEFTIGSKTLGVLSLIYPDDNEINIQVNGILQWNKLPGATNYQIQVSTSQDFEKPIIDYIVGAQLEYDYQKLSYDTKYYWRVRGFNSKDVSEWSNPYSFTTEMLTSVEANYNINDGLFKFYPNPATDKIQFSDKRYTGTKYYIINMQGITLLEGIIVSDNIEISYLCPGAYFVKIGNDLIRFIKK